MVVEQGVIGNCRMLATIGKNGELRYLFWPTIDYPQHIHASLPGVSFDNFFSWLTDSPWNREQRYLESTNIIETRFGYGDVEIKAIDFVFPTKDILVRNFSFLSGRKIFLKFFYYKDTHLIETPIGDATYFDKETDAMIIYKRDYYLGYSSDEKSSSHQCGVHGEGSDAFGDVYDGKLNNNALALYLGTRGVNSALSWDLDLEPNEEKQLNIFFGFGRNKQEVLELLDFARKNKNTLLKERVESDKKWISNFHNTDIKASKIDYLIRRSLFLMKALNCSSHGSFIAAPCLEPDYRYCWPRDATYMAYAMDLYGFHEEAESFYLWCKRAQEKDGSWYQRYYIEACCPGPTWGMQCDQAGIVLWGISKHYELTMNKNFLKEMRVPIERASRHLIELIDQDSVISSIDLWEERYAANAYTNATVCAGLREAAKMAKIIGASELSRECSTASEKIKDAILERLWSEEKSRFLKSVKPLDETIDISLLGLSFPFEIIDARDEKMRSTAEQIEKAFNYNMGGIARYPSDVYYGGNPRVLTTLWLAMYYVRLGDIAKASQLISFVVDKTSELGLMPEQLDKNTGEPISAFPLGWSHAMFVIAAREIKQ